MKDKHAYFKCSICNGTGHLIKIEENQVSMVYCSRCKGKGFLDWLENIVGSNVNIDLEPVFTIERKLSKKEIKDIFKNMKGT